MRKLTKTFLIGFAVSELAVVVGVLLSDKVGPPWVKTPPTDLDIMAACMVFEDLTIHEKLACARHATRVKQAYKTAHDAELTLARKALQDIR
jgi:hypothetical protein